LSVELYKLSPSCKLIEAPLMGYIVCGNRLSVVNSAAVAKLRQAVEGCVTPKELGERLVERGIELGHLVNCDVPGIGEYVKVEYVVPLQVSIEATYACNAGCPYCYVWRSIRGKEAFIDVDVVADVFGKLYGSSGVPALNLQITGGEPLLHPRIEELLGTSYKCFRRIALLTNGILLEEYKDFIRGLRDKLVVQVSIDATEEDVYAHGKGVKGSLLRRVLDSIAWLVEHDVIVRIALPVSKINAAYVEKTIKALIDMFGGEVQIVASPVIPIREAKDLSEVFRPWNPVDAQIYAKAVNQFYLMAKKYPRIVLHAETSELRGVIESARNCGAGWRKIAITPGGDVKPCPVFPDIIGLGNIYMQDIRVILNPLTNPAIALLYGAEKPSEETCGVCPYGPHCRGCLARGFEKAIELGSKCLWARQGQVYAIFGVAGGGHGV